MNYYKVSIDLCYEYPCLDIERRRIEKQTKDIGRKTADHNKKSSDAQFFISDTDDDVISMAAVTFNKVLTEERIADFCRSLGIDHFGIKIEEIVLETFRDIAEGSPRRRVSDFNKVSDVLRYLDIGPLRHTDPSFYSYEEDLIDDTAKKDEIINETDKLPFFKSLKSEIGRIYRGKTSEVSGHPVHYIIETDGDPTVSRVSSLLLAALYSRGRLRSKKYGSVKFGLSAPYSRGFYEAAYKSCTGGALAVDLPECETADPELIRLCSEMFLKYRHQTLTIFRVPKSCNSIKNALTERLSKIGLVEICESDLSAEKARVYLRGRAAEYGVRTDSRLYSGLDGEKRFSRGVLDGMFDVWYDGKLKRSVYPQYKNASFAVEKNAQAAGTNATEELDRMIGLDEAKKTIKNALNYYKIQRLYKKFGVMQDKAAMHMVFTGNPGTAKTTAARIFAKIMKENGILSSGHLVEVGRADLVGKYVGWTARIVKEKFEEAKGGVLFIDEAYSLADGGGDENKNSFGIEAINTIVQEMENERDDLIVIFAGYPDEMKRFLAQNPGLRSRIAFHIEFPDYDTGELCRIAKVIGESRGLTITDDAMKKLAVLFDAKRNESDFGNGRFVRNVIEQSKMNLASRVIIMESDKITKKTLTTIEAEDIVIPQINKSAAHTVRCVGFSV
ncbi:MAG: AAA family ATPase [Clostridia bacterium]|nr:AAA family ATPase [Clostridia bacterium]